MDTSIEHATKRILDAQYQDFYASLLLLYSGPHVKIRIGSMGCEYELSKAILCKQSPYFVVTFEGEFREGQDQSTTPTEEVGVVSECITATIEFVRLADICEVAGMETLMAEHIKTIIQVNPALEDSRFKQSRDPDTNMYSLTSQHITSAALLPTGHPVRRILATAALEGYIRRNKHKFWKDIQESPNFAVDLLVEIKETLKTVTSGKPDISFTDPFSGKELPFVTHNV